MTTEQSKSEPRVVVDFNKLANGNYYRVQVYQGWEILYYNDREFFASGTELPTALTDIDEVDYDEVRIAPEDCYNRHDFMKMYRAMPEAIGEALNNDLTPDDRHEIFRGIMLGESDFSVELFNEILADYGVSWSVAKVENEIQSKDIKPNEVFEVKLMSNVKVEDIKDWLITALEGGSNYWYWIDETEVDKAEAYCKMVKWDEYPALSERIFYAIKGGINIEIKDKETMEVLGTLTWEKLQSTFEIMNAEYPNTWRNLVTGEYDADDADIFFQIWTMGEVVYA